MSSQLQYNNLIILADLNRPGYLSQSTLDGALPTILTNLGTSTIFENMLRTIDKVGKDIYIISKEEHIEILKEYIRDKRPDLIKEIVILPTDEFETNAYNICNTCYHQDLIGTTLIVDSNVLDCENMDLMPFVLLNKPLSEKNYERPTLEVNIGCSEFNCFDILYDDSGFTDTEDNTGNVIGVYAINDASHLGTFSDSYIGDEFLRTEKPGICELFNYLSNDDEYLKNIHRLDIHIFADHLNVICINDEKSKRKYTDNVKPMLGEDNTEFTEFSITKTATSEKERFELAKEIGYYSFWESIGLEPYIPEIQGMSGDDITKSMTSLTVDNPGISVFEYLQNIKDLKERHIAADEIFKKFRRFIEPIHSINDDEAGQHASRKTAYNALKKEYINDLIEMYKQHKNLINSVDVRRVNNVPVPNFNYVIDRLKDFIDDQFSDIDFSVIHGNTGTQNVLFKRNNFQLINLKSNFGDVEYMGDPFKDIALFAVDLIGGDYLKTSLDFKAVINNGDLSVCYNSPTLYGIFKRNDEHEKVITAIYWLKQFTKYTGDPVKAIAVFYSGLNMLNKTLSEVEY